MQNEKFTKVFGFMIGCVISISLFVFVYGQSYTSRRSVDYYRIPTGETFPIRTAGAVKIGEKEPRREESKPVVRARVYKPANTSENTRDTGDKKEGKGGVQPILRTRGFPLDSDATKIINYAYKISDGNMDFVLTLKAENGGFNMYQQSNVVKYGVREQSYGLCQLHRYWHKEVDTKIFRESRKYQVEVCWKKYKGGTKFYGYYVRNKYKHMFYRE